MAKEVILSVRIDKEEKEILEALAKEKGIGASTLVRLLIRELIASKKK